MAEMNASWLPSGDQDKFAPDWCGPVSRNVWPCRSVAHSPRELKVSKGASTRGVAPAPVEPARAAASNVTAASRSPLMTD